MELSGEFNLPKLLERLSTPSQGLDSEPEELVEGPHFAVDPRLNEPPELLYSSTKDGANEGKEEEKGERKKPERRGTVIEPKGAGVR
jgi:hypothetical protein